MSAPDWQDVTFNLFTDKTQRQLICIMLHHIQYVLILRVQIVYRKTVYSSVRLLALILLHYLHGVYLPWLKLSCSVSDELICHSI